MTQLLLWGLRKVGLLGEKAREFIHTSPSHAHASCLVTSSSWWWWRKDMPALSEGLQTLPAWLGHTL